MAIREALIDDASSLAALSIEVWIGTYLRNGVSKFIADYALSTFTAQIFEAFIADENEIILVSDNSDGIDGFVRVTLEAPPLSRTAQKQKSQRSMFSRGTREKASVDGFSMKLSG